MKIEILTLFYGEKHRAMFFETLVDSLWRPSNIPALLDDGCEVVHRIHCPPSDAERMALYAEWSKIPVELVTTILRDDHNYSRHEGLYRCLQEQISRQTLTIMAACDHVFGHGLRSAIKGLAPGDYLCCGHPRLQYEAGVALTKEFLASDNDETNKSLVGFCMDRIPHPMIQFSKLNPRNPHPGHDEYLRLRHREDHWEAFMSEPPPLAWWSTPDMLDVWNGKTLHGPWEAVDHDLPNQAFKRGKLKLITDSRIFFWGEFTHSNIYTQGIYTGLELDSLRYCHTVPLRWYY